MFTKCHRCPVLGGFVFTLLACTSASAAAPTAEVALRLTPSRKTSIRRAGPWRPSARSRPRKWAAKPVGLSATAGPDSAASADTNGDNLVDQWSYFRDGIEVYRDIDANFNGKADQYRWLGTAGTRWGLDKNEDGKIDTWKNISAEEVTAELVAAMPTVMAVGLASC